MTEHPQDDGHVSISNTKTLSAGPSLRRLRRASRAALQAALQVWAAAMDEHPPRRRPSSSTGAATPSPPSEHQHPRRRNILTSITAAPASGDDIRRLGAARK